MSITQVAREGNIDDDTVRKIKRAEKPVHLSTLRELFEGLGLELLSSEESATPDFETFVRRQEAQSEILLSADHQHFTFASQILQTLENLGNSVSRIVDFVQQSDEELEQYDCFLLIESDTSSSEAIHTKLERIEQLQHGLTGNKPATALIHVGTPLSLAIDDPIHRKLLAVPQQRWLPNDENSTQILIQFVQELLLPKPPVQPQSTIGWNELLRSSVSVNNLENWMLTYVGEDPLRKLGGLGRVIKSIS